MGYNFGSLLEADAAMTKILHKVSTKQKEAISVNTDNRELSPNNANVIVTAKNWFLTVTL